MLEDPSANVYVPLSIRNYLRSSNAHGTSVVISHVMQHLISFFI